MLSRMDARIKEFTATGAKVILVLQPPKIYPGVTKQSTDDYSMTARLNSLLRDVAARHPTTVGVVDLSERVCPGGPPCPTTVAGIDLRTDGEHFGSAGSLYAAAWLLPKILQAAHSLH